MVGVDLGFRLSPNLSGLAHQKFTSYSLTGLSGMWGCGDLPEWSFVGAVFKFLLCCVSSSSAHASRTAQEGEGRAEV